VAHRNAHSDRTWQVFVTTQATARTPDHERRQDLWQMATVSVAHFVSHYHQLVLPPLFLFVRDAYGVSFTEIGLALSFYNIVTALFQTPTGFLVDRLGPRRLLIGGLLLASVAFAIVGLVPSFWLFLAMYAVAGLANTVYHPADYAIHSNDISAPRMSTAYAAHTFSGMMGSAAAPATVLLIQAAIGWRGAFLFAALLGLLAAALLCLPGASARERPAAATKVEPEPASGAVAHSDWRFLMQPVILQNFMFYVLSSFSNSGMQNYSVVALGALFATPLAIGNSGLSAYLFVTAFGVLVGGYVAARTKRHAIFAGACLLAFSGVAVFIGMQPLGATGLIVAMAVAGLFSGIIMPSRDVIVREATPPGAFGRVFGFVTTGFNVAGIIAPLVFGALMDHGGPAWVFYIAAATSVVAVITVVTLPKRKMTVITP
jgi:MFS family permease